MATLDLLLQQLKHFPKLGHYVDYLRSLKDSDLSHKWSNWCFLPHEIWDAVAQRLAVDPHVQVNIANFLSVLGTWRYSQGVYRFNPDFFQEVVKSDFSSNLPSEVLLRLPEWCVFVETPELTFMSTSIDGFFAHLEDDRRNNQIQLRLTLVEHETTTPLDLITFPIPLGNWSVEKAYDMFAMGHNNPLITTESPKHTQVFVAAKPESVTIIKKMISLLLYLCTEEPDIVNRKEPTWHPCFPRAKKIKGKLRYFPASKQHIFDVGMSIGKELRQQREQLPSAPTGRHVRSHFRRGHWQCYWYGPKKGSKPGERRCIPKWISPLFVHGGADKTEETPSSYKP